MLNEQNTLFPVDSAQFVSRREFARVVGYAESYIRKLITQGRITAVVNGKIDLDRALEEWRAIHPETHAEGEPAAAETDEFRQIRIRRERMREEREQIELDRFRGMYLHIDDIRETFGPMIERSRELVYQIEPRLLPVLPGNPIENARVIRGVITEILTELVYVEPKAKKRRAAK